MCKVRDAAVLMINKSIALSKSENNENYLMDFIKLHKTLYLAQSYMLARYGSTLFEEPIYAKKCGPYVDGIGFVPGKKGFDLIRTEITADADEVPFFPISFLREEALDVAIKKFGCLSTDEVVQYTKRTSAYKEFAEDNRFDIEIPTDLICETGKEIFGESDT